MTLSPMDSWDVVEIFAVRQALKGVAPRQIFRVISGRVLRSAPSSPQREADFS